MNFTGILAGAATFLIIGISHPLVVKLEYTYGKKGWIILAIAGVIFLALSLFAEGFALSTIFGACAFSLFWGVYEMFEQEKRVLRGWFPENPKRHEYYQARRANKAESKQGK